MCAGVLLGPADAGEFTVNPIRLELGANARSGVLGVRNDGGERLTFQLDAMAWTQDGQGKDNYSATTDLVFFPKILSIEPGQQGVIRVGVKNAIVPSEKTYRLFIEELPGPEKKPEAPGAQINVLIRFGAPIFVAPVAAQDRLEIEELLLANGKLTFSARNTGNRHQLVQRVELRGADRGGHPVYALTIADRYLLAGTVKSYSTTIPAEQCARIASLEVEIKTDKADAKHRLDLSRAMCP